MPPGLTATFGPEISDQVYVRTVFAGRVLEPPLRVIVAAGEFTVVPPVNDLATGNAASPSMVNAAVTPPVLSCTVIVRVAVTVPFRFLVASWTV